MSATLSQTIRVIEPVGRAIAGSATALTSGHYTVGSSSECDICVNASGVAPRHCTLTVTQNQVLLTAVSRHTWLNDCPILDQEPLRVGDRIALGPVVMRLRNAEPNEFDQQVPQEPQPGPSEADSQSATDTVAPVGTVNTTTTEVPSRSQDKTPENGASTDRESVPAFAPPRTAPTNIADSVSSLLGDSSLFRESGSQSDDLRSAILARHVQLIGDKQRDLTTQILELELRAAEFEEEITNRERSLASQHLELVGDTRLFARNRQQFDALAAEADEIQTQREEVAAQWSLLEAAQRKFEQKQLDSHSQGSAGIEQQRLQLRAELDQLERQRQQLDLHSERIAQQRHLVAEASEQLASLQEREATLLERELNLETRIQQTEAVSAAAAVPAIAPETDNDADQDAVTQQRAELEQRAAQLQHDRRAYQQQCDASTAQLQQRGEELTRLEQAHAEGREKLDTDLQQLHDEQRQLQETAEKLETSRLELEAQKQHLDDTRNELAARTACLDERATTLDRRSAELQQQVQAQAEEKLRLDARQSEVEALEAETRQTATELEQRSQSLDEREQQTQIAIGDTEQLEKLRAEIAGLHETHAARQQQMEEKSAHLDQLEQERVAEWQVRCDEFNAQQDEQRTVLQQLEQQLAEQNTVLQDRATSLARAEADLASQREQFAELERLAEELSSRQAEIESREEAMGVQEAELAKLTQSLEAREAELSESQARLESHQTAMADAADPEELEQLREQQSALQQQLIDSQAALQQAESQLAEANAAFEATQQELIAARDQIVALQESEQASTDNSELLEEIDHLKMLLEHRNCEVESLREDLRQSAEQVPGGDVVISKEQAEGLAKREADIQLQQTEIQSRQTELDALEERLIDLQAGLAESGEAARADEEIEQELASLRAALQERNAEVAELHGRLEDSPVVSSEARERELDERTRRLDERTEHLTDRELDIKRAEDELNGERDRVRSARQELEQRRVELQTEFADASAAPVDETPTAAPTEVSPEESVEQTQHLQELRSELADMFGLTGGAPEDTSGLGVTKPPGAPQTGTEPVEASGANVDMESPDYVASYMEQLLARTRGDDVGTSSTVACQKTLDETKQVMAPLWSNADEPVGGVVAGLSTAAALEVEAEPKKRKVDAETLRADMQSLREVANYSARSALADYAWKRARGLVALRVALIGLSALSAVACYVTHVMEMHSMGWLTVVLALITVIGGVELWYVVSGAKRMKPKATEPAGEPQAAPNSSEIKETASSEA